MVHLADNGLVVTLLSTKMNVCFISFFVTLLLLYAIHVFARRHFFYITILDDKVFDFGVISVGGVNQDAKVLSLYNDFKRNIPFQ